MANKERIDSLIDLSAVETEFARVKALGADLNKMIDNFNNVKIDVKGASSISAIKQAAKEGEAACGNLVNSFTNLETASKRLADAEKANAAQMSQYTRSLQDNIKAQIDAANAINANKAKQKEIETAMKAAGKATDEQVASLSTLKQEFIVLTQTNQGLTTTIRNQAKEYIAQAGSIDQLQAKVNLLQQAYERLSESERQSPFGQQLKSEIDVLEPKVKELEGTIGKFQRNVGNYPSSFTGAFKVLGEEINTIQGKLVQGNFGAKETEDLTKKQTALNNITQTLGKTFTSTSQESAAYKEAAKQVGATFGTDSNIFKSFAKAVGEGNDQLKEQDKAVIKATGGAKGLGDVFSRLWGLIRTAANVIPGMGIGGVVLLLLTPLSALASKLFDVTAKAKDTKKSLIDLAESQKTLNAALATDEYKTAVKNVTELKENIDLAKQGFLDKEKVLHEYNETIGKTTGQVKTLNEAEIALAKNADAYVQMTLYKAAANLSLEQAAKKAVEAAQQNLIDQDRVNRLAEQNQKKHRDSEEKGLDEFLEHTAKSEKAANDESGKRQVDTFKNIAADFQKKAAEIAKQYHFDFFGGGQDDKNKTKTITDIIAELRKELQSLSNEESIGRLAPSEADVKKVEAYSKAFKGLFDINVSDKAPIVKQLQVEVAPIDKRVLEQKIHDIMSGIKPQAFPLPTFADDEKAQRDLIIKNTTDSIKKISQLSSDSYASDLANLKSNLDKKLITQKEYEAQVDALKKQHDRAELDNAIALDEALIGNLKARSDGSKEALDQIAGYEEDLNKLKAKLYEDDVKNNEEAEKKKQRDAEKYAAAVIKTKELQIQLAKEAANLLVTLVTASIDNEIEAVKNLEAEQQKNHDNEVDRINSSTLTQQEKENKIAVLDKQRQAEKDQNDNREKEMELKKAKFQKAVDAAKVITATAAAEVQALTYLSNPVTAPLYPGIAALIGAVGAIQLATVLATPLPKFAVGTSSSPEGPAIVGELGAELYKTPSGEMGFTPSVPTLTWLEKGTQIIPHDKVDDALYKIMLQQTAGPLQAVQPQQKQYDFERLEDLQRSLINAVKANKPQRPAKNNSAFQAHIINQVYK